MLRSVVFTLALLPLGSNAQEVVVRTQSFLSKLGYQPGVVDGLYGRKTEDALTRFYADQQNSYGGTIDETVVADLIAALEQQEIRISPVAGFELENFSEPMLYPPEAPGVTRERYAFGRYWVNVDWNGDGLRDYLYTGTMVPTNATDGGVDTGGACGAVACEGDMPGPTLYLAQPDGTYRETNGLFIDQRDRPGQSLARQNLVADYNGDNVPDLFIADHGLGTHDGVRDSYFLSQSGGTWLESSATHLSDANYRIFDHGASTGDIDNDGDMDIVLTELDNRLTCWINDGVGHLSKRTCGNIGAFGIELGDLDNDGDLDLVHAGHEYDGTPTGVALNDGTGRFSRAWNLQQIEEWGTVPEVAVWDLDKDGDLDIVLSRAGPLYVGTALQLHENLGEGEFSAQFYPLVEAPESFDARSEGHEWNNFIDTIRFSDVDDDGHDDVYLIGGGYGPKTDFVRGSILMNEGNFVFEHIPNSDDRNPVEILPEAAFYDDPQFFLARLEPQRGHSTDTEASRAFASFLQTVEPKAGEASEYDLIEDPILLPTSGAAIIGIRNFGVDEGGGEYDVLIDWAGHKLSASICIEHYPGNDFTAHRVKFGSRGFAGLRELETYGNNYCQGKSGYVGNWELKEGAGEIGLVPLLNDIADNGQSIIAGLPVLSDEEKVQLLSTMY